MKTIRIVDCLYTSTTVRKSIQGVSVKLKEKKVTFTRKNGAVMEEDDVVTG